MTPWTWSLESDKVEWLPVFEAATAANGDVVLAGPVSNQEVLSDGLGTFWLARLTAAGDLVWQFKYDDLHLQPFDLEIAPDGDIVVVGMILNIVSTSEVHRFTGEGALLWSAAQDPFDESPTQTSYHSLAVDADAVYVVGQRREHTDDLPIAHRVHLRALDRDGAPLWQLDRPPPEPIGVSVGGIALTGGKLVVSLSRHGIDIPFEPLPGYSLLTFDTAGVELSWNDYSLPAPWRGGAGKLVAAEDGGVFLAGGATGEGQSVQHVARVGPDGAVLWSKLAAGNGIRDALLAPDDRFYVLTETAITSYDLNGSP
ncbi:outer membrane protein assembly factor BamB family protein [Nannocystis punicea]|uniref:PQQ-binding-like beta-propeller repeat protein n=1 Tax=Nannocystis punicea TaxID=2995304 RepID=A0ABY7HBG7_9BACT|nr:PQQ-binding-like beta-propeller repeat protein [Nannocystis poenicansa]WAS96612.1 PQQ-binding-like beta-propeller repeat protein [Nannocystis poenicansa]